MTSWNPPAALGLPDTDIDAILAKLWDPATRQAALDDLDAVDDVRTLHVIAVAVAPFWNMPPAGATADYYRTFIRGPEPTA